ncbi:flavin monoamine oxidase family protein [Sphingomonas immobilis]|uniref:Tryptophan 2-monooxygenase n=1 Tax=Sphingomonas immobilis TaxID=3063997 RepID=A0ABT8ZT52_9SPHN|nr:NAD(P)/FAD-dependent oxidoreductase [Sphingomonas sp. CA1-15]MDO7840744.1 NAD(P)/FAD-dependent oxidoreductase [Sphingomonas sp. CA1-15]
MDCDIAIIGAGAAGISAARTLRAAGRSVLLIEASDRAGGRGWTLGMGGMPLDMGCGWLHSAERNPLVGVALAGGFDVVGGDTAWRAQWRDLGFPREDQDAAMAAWEALSERLNTDPPASDRAADALTPGGDWNAFCQSLSGYMNGASLDRLSVADFLAYDNAATDANWRVREGYGSLLAASLPDVRLLLSCPVRKVAQSGQGVRLDTDRGPVEARAVIVTASTNVLASGAIAIAGADDHLHAASQLPLGLADKLFFELHGDHGFEPETHLLGNPRNAGTGSYYIMALGRPVIEGFFGGPGAVSVEDAGPAAAFAFALDELVALLGSGVRRHVRPLVASAWCRTDWIRGSYSHALPGHAAARAILARPVAERIFFAGEATHATDFSTAHGAWESGARAAGEALALI